MKYVPTALIPTALFTLFLLGFAAAVDAQQIQLAAQRGPYYVGEPVVVQVIVDGVDSKYDIDCRFKGEAPDGVTVTGPQVGRQVRSFTQIINGRMTSHESINYQFGFVVTADRTGEYTIGPFELIVNGKSQEVAGKVFRFGELENDPDMQLDVSIPRSSVYVGQEVPVTIRWSFAGDIEVVRYAFARLQIRSPLFDQFPFRDFRPRTRTTLSIATAKGGVEIDAKVTQEQIDSRDFIVVTGQRIMVPDTPGRFTDIPVTCRTEKVVSWERDLFGDPRPGRQQPALAAGDPIDLIVKPIPQSGRPASFSGAIGRGYSIDVSANRSVVRVGDPISLNVSVRGDGNLERISLPKLSRNEGFSPDRFQVLQDEVTGTVDGNVKQFKVNVQVKDPQVTQVPAVAFSWFDPYEERFGTAMSKPIALQVMDARKVSAADVVSSVPLAADDPDGRSPGNGESDAENDVSQARSVGANLAITRDPVRLLANGDYATRWRTIVAACYALAVTLVLGSILLRQHAARDQDAILRKKRLRALQSQIEKAARLPVKESADEIAKALRELLPDAQLSNRTAIDQLIAQCDNISYTTGQLADVDAAQIAAEALQFVRDAENV